MIVPGKVYKKDRKKGMRLDIREQILAEAQYYYKATLILEKERKKGELFPPVITNATFACELFSKAIIYKKEEGMVKGHLLKGLYDRFPDDVKSQINDFFPNDISDEALTKFIDDIDELFEFWRYRYEHCGYSTHYSFVLEYMEILKEVTQNLVND